MSRKTSIPRKTIIKDPGIQTYRSCKEGFADSMRLTTFKQADDEALVRESEFAKPYDPEFEDYSAMEYEAPYYPPFGIDHPDMGDLPEFYDPWHILFHCTTDPCYCEGQTQRFFAQCSQEIIAAEIVPPHAGLSATYSNNSILIKADSNAKGIAELTITMKALTPKSGGKDGLGLWQRKYKTVHGTHSGIFVSRCKPRTTYTCCDVASPVAWDDGNSDDTVAQSSTAAIAITGTGAPFTWSVSGTGYTLDYAVTEGLANTLNADGSACGTANITVKDCDGKEVIGYVTCSTGVWTQNFITTTPVLPRYTGPSCLGYCGQGGTGGHYYFTLKHRADRGTVNYYCCGDNGASWQFLYNFDDGYQVTHADLLFKGTGAGNFYGPENMNGETVNVAGTPGGESWECA